MVVAAAKREDNIIRVIAVDYQNEVDEFNLDNSIEFVPNKMWLTMFEVLFIFYKR